jgi:hypothetical protein
MTSDCGSNAVHIRLGSMIGAGIAALAELQLRWVA